MKSKPSRDSNKIKVTSRNKELTKRLLLDAAKDIIDKEGLKNLGINKMADKAGRSKRMIYDYFGGLEGVLHALLQETDHWLSYENHISETLDLHKDDKGREFSGLSFKKHFHQFYHSQLLQEVSLLELQDSDPFFTELSNKREKLGEEIFTLSEEHFRYTDVHFRSVCALLLGGINYMVLHSKARNSPFCGIDISEISQQANLRKTIEQITKWAFDHAKKQS